MSYRPHPTKNKKLPTGYNGSRWWYLDYYPHGKKGGMKSRPFYGTEEEASFMDLELRSQLHGTRLSINCTLNEAAPDFIQDYKLDHLPRATERVILSLKHLSGMFGRYGLVSITADRITEYKRKRLEDGVKRITINKELNALSSLLKWAKGKGYIAEALHIELFPPKQTRSPVPIMPTAQEIEAIIEQIGPTVKGIAMLEYYAGLRRNEALYLRVEDVLLDRRLLIVTGKGGKQRIVPVVHQALLDELARKIKEMKIGYLWISPFTKRPYRDIKDSLKAAAKRAGFDGRIYNHLLRHGFGTTAIESGIDLRSVQGLMGHTTSRTTELYTHLAATHLMKQMEKFGNGDKVKHDTEKN